MPNTIKEAVAQLILRWDADVLDYESERRALIEVTNGVGELLLPRGPKGEPGFDGEPGPKLAPDVVVEYADDTEAYLNLPAGLAEGDRGYVVLNDTTKTAWFWNGEQWRAVHDVVGLQGEIGPSVGFSIGTVTTSPSGGSAQVSINPASTATNKIIDLTLPRGNQGAVGIGQKGEPGDAILTAGDFEAPAEGAAGMNDGAVPVWDTTVNKFVPQIITSGPAGPYGIGPNEFMAVNDNDWAQDYKIVAERDIPPQPFAWHPRVFAYQDVRVTGIQARVDLEARLGSPTGPVVGRGPGSTVTSFLDNYTGRSLQTGFEGGPVDPDSTAFSVPAGQATTIYFVLQRIDTLATFGVSTRKDRASATVYCDPIPGSET